MNIFWTVFYNNKIEKSKDFTEKKRLIEIVELIKKKNDITTSKMSKI